MAVAESAHQDSSIERRFVLDEIPWWMYVALRDAIDAQDSGVKLTYLEGTLEFMSPSNQHELAKKVIARLIETWAVEHDLDLRGAGSTTFRREAKRRGLEPDECYKLGPIGEDDVPDIAVEVIVTAPLVDKLAVYAGLGVREVWTWRPGGVVDVHVLHDGAYAIRARSEVLPELDLGELSRFVKPDENQTALVKAYRAALARPGS